MSKRIKKQDRNFKRRHQTRAFICNALSAASHCFVYFMNLPNLLSAIVALHKKNVYCKKYTSPTQRIGAVKINIKCGKGEKKHFVYRFGKAISTIMTLFSAIIMP